jgi:branched-chain amino acid transport system permease protein
MPAMLTILVDGVAYGMLLFVLAVGLSVTLGLMNFINLAHGAFAMAGGYLGLVLVNRMGVPFFAALPLIFLGTGLIGVVIERTLYVHVYAKSHLDQVLFTIGLVFMAVSAVDYFAGSQQQFIDLPPVLRQRFEILGISIGAYRGFIIVICGVLALVLQLVLSHTRFGAQLRAGVDNRDVARGLGINVGLVFTATFAAGSGLAGLGGALGAELLGLDPTFPLKFMVYFLIVVTVGGTSSLTGPLVGAIILGIADVAGKYYAPSIGAFVIYTVMVVILIWRPNGLFARSDSR